MALAKIIPHFPNLLLSEKQLTHIDAFLTSKVRKLFHLYQSTTKDIIYLPRTVGGIGVKKFSACYMTTRVSFIVKMLNHDVPCFKNIARNSLEIDMRKRGIHESLDVNNFLGYKVNIDGFLVSTTNFGCRSNWIELNRYCRKLDIRLQWRNDKVRILIGDNECMNMGKSSEVMNTYVNSKALIHAKSLSLQGNYLGMENISPKISHSILYNWKLNDQLLIFCVKARLNILPTNFTTYIWNRDNDPRCPFCKHCTESMAHLLNGCQTGFKNFYSKRHDRIVDYIFEKIKKIDRRYKAYKNKLFETFLPNLVESLLHIQHRKPDITLIDPVNKICNILEITVCYDLYFDYAYETKINRYNELVTTLNQNGINTNIYVLCFGSLGCVPKSCYRNIGKFIRNNDDRKLTLKWCSISNIIAANYIWRHRLKKLT